MRFSRLYDEYFFHYFLCCHNLHPLHTSRFMNERFACACTEYRLPTQRHLQSSVHDMLRFVLMVSILMHGWWIDSTAPHHNDFVIALKSRKIEQAKKTAFNKLLWQTKLFRASKSLLFRSLWLKRIFQIKVDFFTRCLLVLVRQTFWQILRPIIKETGERESHKSTHGRTWY